MKKKPKVVKMRYVDWTYINKIDQFSNVHANCEICGVAKLKEMKEVMNEELILQFFATVQFEDESIKSFTWMSNSKQYSSNIYEFAEVLGLPAIRNPNFETIHKEPKYKKKDMICLYDVNNSKRKLGITKGLHQGIFTLNYLLRYTLDPKVGDTTNIRGHSKNMLVLPEQNTDFNVMDYVYECIKEASYEQVRSFPIAPYSQKLINHVVRDQKLKLDTKHKVCKSKKELSITSVKYMKAPTTRPNI